MKGIFFFFFLTFSNINVNFYICAKKKPPFHIFRQTLGDVKSKKKHAGSIRQYVAITGLNLEDFDRTMEGLGKVHRYFENSLPSHILEPMIPLFDDYVAFGCHSRYFNSIRHGKSIISHPFGPDVDPNGDLELLRGDSHIHTEDNVVQYLGKKVDDGKTK